MPQRNGAFPAALPRSVLRRVPAISVRRKRCHNDERRHKCAKKKVEAVVLPPSRVCFVVCRGRAQRERVTSVVVA